MIEQIKLLIAKFYKWDRGLTQRVNTKLIKVEKVSHLAVVLVFFGFTWIFAWNAHIIGPWIDHLLGTGPHDIDSIGKIRWRRIYSTAFCAPPIIYAIFRYAYNKWQKRY